MNTKVHKAYYLIPVVYAAVIIFLLYMQFSGSHSFSAEVSDIALSGRTHTGAPGHEDEITDLTISCNGVEFSFGEENPLLVYSQDGLTHSTRPLDYRVTSSGIDIMLTKGISLSFFYNHSNTLNILLTADDPESIRYIHLPVSGENTELSAVENIPVLSITSESSADFFLSMPETGSYDADRSVIVLFPEESGPSELSFEQAAASGLDAFTYWLNGNNELVSSGQLDSVITNYIEKSAEALTGSRYNSTRGTWLNGSGGSTFSEEALVMSAAETLGTSSYKNTKEQLDRAAASHSRNLSLLSVPLFGNIVNTVWTYDEEIIQKPSQLKALAEAADYSVFSDSMIIAALFTDEAAGLIDPLAKIIMEAPDNNITIEDAIAALFFYTELFDVRPDLTFRFRDAEKLIEPVVLPNIKIIADNLFIADEDNRADILLSLKTGVVLLKLSEINPVNLNNDYSRIGRELINSVISLSDNSGFLPETVSLAESGDLLNEGTIPPEAVYPLLSDNPYYPAEDYFYPETGENISVINQAERFDLEKTESGYSLSFDFPAGQTHTFAIRNIRPFYQVNLLGYKWNPDHRFLNYSSGWWYDKQHNTLFVKIRHRETTENMLITVDVPPSPSAAEAAAETVDAAEAGGGTEAVAE